LQASNLELGNQSLLESVDDLSRKNEDLTQVWFYIYPMLPTCVDLFRIRILPDPEPFPV
jgi:hypothetical protein